MNEERDWIDEERLLGMVYIHRGYSEVVAADMAQREIEERKVQAGYLFKTAKRKDKRVSEKWVYLAVHSDERLQCDTCNSYVIGCSVHLCINRVQEVDEVRCNKCWDEIEREEIK